MDNYWLHMVGGGCKYVHKTDNVVLEKEKITREGNTK